MVLHVPIAEKVQKPLEACGIEVDMYGKRSCDTVIDLELSNVYKSTPYEEKHKLVHYGVYPRPASRAAVRGLNRRRVHLPRTNKTLQQWQVYKESPQGLVYEMMWHNFKCLFIRRAELTAKVWLTR